MKNRRRVVGLSILAIFLLLVIGIMFFAPGSTPRFHVVANKLYWLGWMPIRQAELLRSGHVFEPEVRIKLLQVGINDQKTLTVVVEEQLTFYKNSVTIEGGRVVKGTLWSVSLQEVLDQASVALDVPFQ